MKKVSVCILAYKSAYLEEVITAIRNQTYKNISIEIRDDCSPENLKEIAERHVSVDDRISYGRNDNNLRELYCWMEFIEKCESEYLLSVHDDDIFSPVLIEKELEILEKFTDVVAVSGLRNEVDASGKVIARLADVIPYQSDMYFKPGEYIEYFASTLMNIFSHMAMMVRVEPIKNIVYNLKNKTIGDIGLTLSFNENHSIYIIHEALVGYRQHKEQVSRSFIPYNKLNPSELFRNAYEIVKYNIGETKSRKVRGWTENYIFQFELLNSYYTKIPNITYELSKALDRSVNTAALGCFAMQLLYLKEKGNKNSNYKIWGAGINGELTKQIIDLVLPNYIFTGYIDQNKTGKFGEWDIVKLEEYDFFKSEYFFISHYRNFSGFESLGKLMEMGQKMPEDFMLGYGFPIHSLISI